MDESKGAGAEEARNPAEMIPSGGVPLSEERRRQLAAQWEAAFRTLRRMDEIDLGETEPITQFQWREEET